jgi:type IV secretory pathway VirD2 relaxase
MARHGDDEREIRLRPPKPKVRNDGAVWAKAFKQIMHYARTSRKASRSGGGGSLSKATKPVRARFQRCAVRASYSRNATPGQWRAHGRYVERESATIEDDCQAVGFDGVEKGIDMAGRLAGWQTAGDERLWKLILSPEFGDRIDLERLTRDVLKRMEQDVGAPLEWVAVIHYNTEHPHIHVAVRGRTEDGRPLLFSRDYIKQGIRAIAEDYCTRQLGYRTALDAVEAERREVTENRFTSLDRSISRGAAEGDTAWFSVITQPEYRGLREMQQTHEVHVASRLAVLQRMGLAQNLRANTWRVRRDFEGVLRAMQRTNDHQKILAAHGVLMSDERLSITILDWRQTPAVEGRILVHGQDELSGRNYLMLEGTDARVHYIQYTPEMEQARGQGKLRTNAFVRLRRLFVDGAPSLQAEDLGRADDILKDRRHLNDTAQKLIKRGIIPTEDGWGGWLGRYQAAVREAALQADHDFDTNGPGKTRDRRRERDRSRSR